MPFFAQVVGVLVGAWDWIWPIASTLGTLAVAIWGLIHAWPQIRRVFTVSDTVGTLPELIAELRTDIAGVKQQTQALEEKSDRKEEKLEALQGEVARMHTETVERMSKMDGKLESHLQDYVIANTEYSDFKEKLEALYGEMTHNGGSSMKDSMARLELRVNGYEQLPGETLEAATRRMRNVLVASTAPLPIPLDTP